MVAFYRHRHSNTWSNSFLKWVFPALYLEQKLSTSSYKQRGIVGQIMMGKIIAKYYTSVLSLLQMHAAFLEIAVFLIHIV